MLRSIGKQSGGIRGVSPEEEKVGYGGKDLQKRKVLSLEWKSEGVMDDESGELMELMEEEIPFHALDPSVQLTAPIDNLYSPVLMRTGSNEKCQSVVHPTLQIWRRPCVTDCQTCNESSTC